LIEGDDQGEVFRNDRSLGCLPESNRSRDSRGVRDGTDQFDLAERP
jgi:hypothetical protein